MFFVFFLFVYLGLVGLMMFWVCLASWLMLVKLWVILVSFVLLVLGIGVIIVFVFVWVECDLLVS